MRTSLSLALILMVISEMVASTNGIGFFILESQRSFDDHRDVVRHPAARDPRAMLLNAIFTLVERRVLRWHRGARASALS